MKKNQTALHLTQEAHSWLSLLAQQNGVSLSVMVEKLIRREAVRKELPEAREWE